MEPPPAPRPHAKRVRAPIRPASVLAFTALARNPNASINLGAFAQVGDQLFGTGLLVGALLSVLASVMAGRRPRLEDDPDRATATARAVAP